MLILSKFCNCRRIEKLLWKARKMVKPQESKHLTKMMMLRVVMKKSAAGQNPRNALNLDQNQESGQTRDQSPENVLDPGQEKDLGLVHANVRGHDLGHGGVLDPARAAGHTPAVGVQFHVAGSVLFGAGECLLYADAVVPVDVDLLAVSDQCRVVEHLVNATGHVLAANGHHLRSGQRNGQTNGMIAPLLVIPL